MTNPNPKPATDVTAKWRRTIKENPNSPVFVCQAEELLDLIDKACELLRDVPSPASLKHTMAVSEFPELMILANEINAFMGERKDNANK